MTWWGWLILGILSVIVILQLVFILCLIRKLKHTQVHNRKLRRNNQRHMTTIQQLEKDCYNLCVEKWEAKMGLADSEKLRKQAEGKLKLANSLVIKGTFRGVL